MRLSITLIAAALLAGALSAPAFAGPFSDVPTDHWAYDAIDMLQSEGIVEGYPDGTFNGDRSFTRQEMAMVVARLLVEAQMADKERDDEALIASAEFKPEFTDLGRLGTWGPEGSLATPRGSGGLGSPPQTQSNMLWTLIIVALTITGGAMFDDLRRRLNGALNCLFGAQVNHLRKQG